MKNKNQTKVKESIIGVSTVKIVVQVIERKPNE